MSDSPAGLVPLAAAGLLLACSAPQAPPEGGASPEAGLRVGPLPGRAYRLRSDVVLHDRRGELVEVTAEASGLAPESGGPARPALDLSIEAVRTVRNGRIEEDHNPEGLAAALGFSESGEVRSVAVRGGDAAAHLAVGLLLRDLMASRPSMPASGARPGSAWTGRRLLELGGPPLELRLEHRLEGIDDSRAVILTAGEVVCARAGCVDGSLESEVRGRAAISLDDGLTGQSTLAVTVRWLPPDDAGWDGPVTLLSEERTLVVASGDEAGASLPSSGPAPGALASCHRRLVELRARLEAIPLHAGLEWADPVDLPEAPGRPIEEHGLVVRLSGREIFAGGGPGDERDERLDSVEEAIRLARQGQRELPCAVDQRVRPEADERPVVYLAMARDLPLAAVRSTLVRLAAGARLALLVRAVDPAGTTALPERLAAGWRRVRAARAPNALAEAVREQLGPHEEGCPGATICLERGGRTCPRLATAEAREHLLSTFARCGCRARDPEAIEALLSASLDARSWPWRSLALPVDSDAEDAPALGLTPTATVADLARALADLPADAPPGGVRW